MRNDDNISFGKIVLGLLVAAFAVWLVIAYVRQYGECEKRGGVLVKGGTATGYVCIKSGLP